MKIKLPISALLIFSVYGISSQAIPAYTPNDSLPTIFNGMVYWGLWNKETVLSNNMEFSKRLNSVNENLNVASQAAMMNSNHSIPSNSASVAQIRRMFKSLKSDLIKQMDYEIVARVVAPKIYGEITKAETILKKPALDQQDLRALANSASDAQQEINAINQAI